MGLEVGVFVGATVVVVVVVVLGVGEVLDVAVALAVAVVVDDAATAPFFWAFSCTCRKSIWIFKPPDAGSAIPPLFSQFVPG